MPIVISYVAIVVSLAVLDFLWIGVLFKDFYQKGLAPYLAQHFTIWAAVLLYVIYAFGVWYFASQPSAGWLEALGRGALLGFVAYSLYDLTNIATFASWPLGLGVLDILWGTILTACGSVIGYLVLQYFSK